MQAYLLESATWESATSFELFSWQFTGVTCRWKYAWQSGFFQHLPLTNFNIADPRNVGLEYPLSVIFLEWSSRHKALAFRSGCITMAQMKYEGYTRSPDFKIKWNHKWQICRITTYVFSKVKKKAWKLIKWSSLAKGSCYYRLAQPYGKYYGGFQEI